MKTPRCLVYLFNVHWNLNSVKFINYEQECVLYTVDEVSVNAKLLNSIPKNIDQNSFLLVSAYNVKIEDEKTKENKIVKNSLRLCLDSALRALGSCSLILSKLLCTASDVP